MIETVPSGTVIHERYRIERVLGSGGFGHVYLAIDLKKNQQYAVKEYLVSGSSGQEQLQHEAKVLSQLHHPSLPGFQDAFMERGRYYIVLDYIEGNDLTDLIRIARQRNEVLPISQMLTWVLSICQAVMFMHSQQPTVIHRDIKPDNIRIKPDGTAVLVDLGNAKAVADGARTLFFIRHQGTPGYAPPEQYPGGTGTDARSDVYALGGTLYFALVAQEPPSVSTRNQELQQGHATLPTLQELINSNPPEETPEQNAARQFRLGVTKPSKPAPRHSHNIALLNTLPKNNLEQINYIIHKAMALKPQERYQYVADFANDLKNVINQLPAIPGPETNSTQPDLSKIYETLQMAKDQARQDATINASTQPMGNDSVSVCPRCGNLLTPQNSFCSSCGNLVVNRGNTPRPNPPTDYVQGDKTVIIDKSQMKQSSITQDEKKQGATASSPYFTNRTPVTTGSYNRIPAVTSMKPFQQQIVGVQPMPAQATHRPSAPPQTPPQIPVNTANGSPRPDDNQINTKTLIIVGAIIIIIVAIIWFLVSQNEHHQQPNLGFLLLLGNLPGYQRRLSIRREK